MQNVAAQKHSVAFLQLEGNSFTFPHGYYLMLLVDSSPQLFKLKISVLISRAIQQNKCYLYPSRAAVAGDSAGCKALGWLPVPFLFGRIHQRYFFSLNSFAASPAKSTLSQYVAHTKLLFSKLGFPFLGNRPDSNANSN